MKTFKKIVTYLVYLLGFFIIYLVFATAASYIATNKNQEKYANQNLSIYIKTNGVHTDLVLPFFNEVYDWRTYLNPTLTPNKRNTAQWVSFGWGYKGFYLQTPEWSDLKPSVALKAAFWLSESAMHVTYYDTVKVSDDCIEIKLNQQQYKQLCTFILNRFDKKNDKLQLINTDQNYGANDVFYEAKGRYNLFYTCNTWANNGLKAAGLKASLFTLWDKGIFYHYSKKQAKID